MKKIILFLITCLYAVACTPSTQETTAKPLAVVGTWRLLTGTTVEKKDTLTTDYTKDLSFIKIINDTHFAFLKHDLTKGVGKSATFGAGGGTYTLVGDTYTEHLEYCDARAWENNDFTFTVSVKNDTLTQTGIEKIDSIGVNRVNTEVYVRFNKH